MFTADSAIYAVFTLTGMAATWLIQETKGLSLEYLSNEDQENFITGPLEKPDHQ